MRVSEHPCPNHNNVRVPRACDHKSIRAQTLGLGHVLKKTSSKTNLKAKHSSAKSLLQISLSCTNSAVPKIITFRYLQKPCFSSKRVRNLRNEHFSHSKPIRRHVRVSPSFHFVFHGSETPTAVDTKNPTLNTLNLGNNGTIVY